MKGAIRDGHEVTRNCEFLGNLMGKHDAARLSPPLSRLRSRLCSIYMGDELAWPWSPALSASCWIGGPLTPTGRISLGKTFLHWLRPRAENRSSFGRLSGRRGRH